jgi:hypothetical protein
MKNAENKWKWLAHFTTVSQELQFEDTFGTIGWK